MHVFIQSFRQHHSFSFDEYTKIVENLINNVSNHIKVVLVTQSKHHLSIFNQEIFHLSSGELVD